MGSRKGAVLSDINETGGQENGQEGDHPYEAEDDSIDLIGYKIPKKELPVLQFQKLGSISFDSNAGSNYSGRELRSINFDVKGEYLRVVIRQCHVNPLNIYHQVCFNDGEGDAVVSRGSWTSSLPRKKKNFPNLGCDPRIECIGRASQR